MKKLLFIAAVASVAMLSACAPSQKETVEETPQDNPEMGVIDNGDSLVVTDVDVSSAAEIEADTANQAQ